MCGRTFCAIDPRGIQQACEYRDTCTGERVCPQWVDSPTGETYCPSYNIAPTIFMPVLVSGEHLSFESHLRVLQPMRWGLIPQWHKGNRDSFKTMHNNCRGETITEKSTFSVPFKKGKRCVVIAEGFYEWKTAKGKKTPYLFTPKGSSCSATGSQKVKSEAHTKENIKSAPEVKVDSNETADEGKPCLLFMAGIFDVCKEEAGQLFSFSILTTEAVGAVAEIHHRMPVLLETDDDIERWLNYQQYPSSKVKDLISPRDCLKSHQVTDKVNNVRYKEPDCCHPITSKPEKMVKGDIRNWFTKSEPTKRKTEPLAEVSVKVKKEMA